MKKGAKFAVILGPALLSFYLLWITFVGTFSLHELLIGIIAALLAGAGMVVVTVQYPAKFSPSLGELLSFWRLPWDVLSGTGTIFAVAARDLMGIEPAASLFRVVRFNAGSKENPRATARRVLAVLFATTTPPTIVLGINTSSQKLLFHELKRSPISKTLKRLGADA